MNMERWSSSESDEGKDWGVEAQSKHTLSALPAEEVLALVSRLKFLNTVVYPAPLVNQNSQEEWLEVTEIQWEHVSRGKAPHTDAIPGRGMPLPMGEEELLEGTAGGQAPQPPLSIAQTTVVMAGG